MGRFQHGRSKASYKIPAILINQPLIATDNPYFFRNFTASAEANGLSARRFCHSRITADESIKGRGRRNETHFSAPGFLYWQIRLTPWAVRCHW
jgi:hypothetical protein